MSQLRSDQTIDVRIDRIDQSRRGTHHITSRDLILSHRIERNLDGHRYPPQPAQDQISQRLSRSCDTSIPLFSLFLRISEEHDRRKDELLKGETDSILVLVSHCVGHHRATSPFTRKF